LVDNLLPSRFSFEMAACLAAVIAFGLDDIHGASALSHRHGPARPRWKGAAFAVAILAVLIVTQLPAWPNQFGPTPAVALPVSVRRAIPAGDPVAITYPYVTYLTYQPMLWQADDDFGFRLLGGYGDHTSSPATGPSTLYPSYMSPPGLQQFLAGQDPPSAYGPPLPVTTGLVRDTRSALSRYHVRLVVVARSVPGSGPVMDLFRAALGSPKVSAGQFSLWADWPDSPTRPIYTNLSTSVRRPAAGARLSGTAVLDAEATDYFRVTKVEFLLTDESHHSTIIAIASPSIVGWIAEWKTATVTNGTYTLHSVAFDGTGTSDQSTGVTITINN
jgi:hypothetical protein